MARALVPAASRLVSTRSFVVKYYARHDTREKPRTLQAAAEFAPDYLCQQTLAWARQHPQDPRVPEALHLAVRATRFGNTGSKTTGLSKAAFQFLHSNYANSTWAAQTKFWY